MRILTPVHGSTPFQLTLPLFEGSTDELARLVGLGKIEAGELSVAAMTHQFEEYLQAASEIDLHVVGDFLAASSRVMLLKSSRALAWQDDEELDDLTVSRTPLIDLPSVRAAAGLLATGEGNESYPVQYPTDDLERRLQPRPAALLVRAWGEMARRASDAGATAVRLPSFVRLETAVSGLIRRLRSGSTVSFRSLVRGAGRGDAVVHFLAVLELLRRREAVAVQEKLFGDIAVRPADDVSETSARAG